MLDVLVFTLRRLLEAPGTQRAFAAVLSSLDLTLIERLRVKPDIIDPALFAEVAALWSRGDVTLRAWFLELVTRATDLTAEQTSLAVERADEALAISDLAGTALDLLRRLVTLPAETLARVATLARTAGSRRTQRFAFAVLKRSGFDLSADLEASDPQTRLAAADAMGDSAKAEPVRIAIATDERIARELRRDAMTGIRDLAVKTAVCLDLGLAGDDETVGSLRWVMTPEAIHALERLVVEAMDPKVRTIAAHVLKSRHAIEALTHQPSRPTSGT